MINPKKENFLCKGCKHLLNFEWSLGDYFKDCDNKEKEECLKDHLCLDCRIVKKEAEFRKSLDSKDAIFYCQKCKIYTNDKTPITSCVFCDTALIRTNHQVIDYV